MSSAADRILSHLQVVASERAARQDDPTLQRRVLALKGYQQARFRRSYADLLAEARHREAATFFLEELYGPDDFSDRDAQFARIVPALVRLFPENIVATVETLSALHALSERLDTTMARHLPDAPISAAAYAAAWQATGQPQARSDQIKLTLEVGQTLDRITRHPMLRHSLRLMRGPATAAGLAALQGFLEQGFDAFRKMHGAQVFLRTVAERETALMQRLFEEDAVAMATVAAGNRQLGGDPLGQLP